MKIKLILLQMFSFVASIAPLAVTVVVRWGEYVKSPSDSVRLGIGCIFVVLFVILKVLGKLRMPKRIAFFAIVLMMSYLLKPIIDDLILLSAMALAGEFIDAVFFQRKIESIRENIRVGKISDATAKQVETIISKYMSDSGRV